VTSPGQWTRIEAALDEILALPESQWAAACARIAGEDAGLRDEIGALLACAGGEDPILDRPLTAPTRAAADSHYSLGHYSLEQGARVGPYRIVAVIGRGGMGEVYRAERADGQFEQQVALKLVQREAAGHIDRFHTERQILARLEHPGIARLHDGGVAEDGRPYMIMELVDGRPILEWCSEQRLELAQRLKLFMEVCDAVAYAHRNLVVHRDLKPANVLVTRAGEVKLLDFGVARLVGADREEHTQNAPLTPAYAAPEQLTRGAVTTATDVYALGMLLFELLSGARPWRLAELPLVAGLEKVLREAPPALSATAEQQTDPPVAPALLRGDLDAIVAKALRKEPEHRYETVSALKADIAHSLNHEPVTARAGARLYVIGRLVRRHRLLIASGTLVAVAVVAGVIGVLWQAQRAEHETARAIAVKDFLVSVFRASDPRIASDQPRGQITARELLDASADRIEKQFDADPELELLGTVALICRELGETDRYIALQAHEMQLARARFGELHPVITDVLLDRADDAIARSDYPAAEQLLQQTDGLIHRAGRDRSAVRARWWLTHGQALIDDSSAQPERLRAFEKALALYQQVAPTDPQYVDALNEIGNVYLTNMDSVSAAEYFRRAVTASQSVHDRSDADVQTIYGNLALALSYQGDFAGADRAYETAARMAEQTEGKASVLYWVPEANHAMLVNQRGQRQRALQMFEELMRFLPPDSVANHDAAEARERYGAALSADGLPTQAIPLLELAQRHFLEKPEYDYEPPFLRLALGDAYDKAGRTEEARRALKAALDWRVQNNPPDIQPVMQIRERWGRFLLAQGDLAGAEAQFQEVLAQAHGRRFAQIALAQGGLARLDIARHDVTSAVRDAKKAVDLFDDVQGFRDVRVGPYLWRVYAQALLQAGDPRDARVWAQKALNASVQYDAPESASISEARALLAATAEGQPQTSS
jgi:serine/threonine-protein kinase